MAPPTTKPIVGLMVTCLIDALRPDTGDAIVRLLEASGCDVDVPMAQTCCGQPNWNGGDRKGAVSLSRRIVGIFEPYDYVVVPSGSCAGQLRLELPRILADDEAWRTRAETLAAKTYELSQFLRDVMKFAPPRIGNGKVAFHDSCSAMRQMATTRQPRELLAAAGYEVIDNPSFETCCGFGGMFAVKYGDVSAHMGREKLAALEATGAPIITSCDLGCLIHIKGIAERQGSGIACAHLADLLVPPDNSGTPSGTP